MDKLAGLNKQLVTLNSSTTTKLDTLSTKLDTLATKIDTSNTRLSVTSGSTALWTNKSIGSGRIEETDSIDMGNYQTLLVFGKSSYLSSGTSNRVQVFVSHDNTTFYEHTGVSIVPNADGHFGLQMAAVVRYWKFLKVGSVAKEKSETISLVVSYKN